MKRNVFILALEEQQRQELQTLRRAKHTAFHSLLDVDTLVEPETLEFNKLLDRMRKELLAFPGSVDAIVAHWDFPTSVMAPILCKEYEIPAPSIESVLKCEHKFWSRQEQKKVFPDMIPRFCSVKPFAENPLDDIEFDFPFWLKPVKAFSAQLGFKIENEEQFHAAIKEIRKGIHHLGDPFNEALDHADLPEEIREADGNTCIAEQLISGKQAAPEGTVFKGEFNVHGIFDQPKPKTEGGEPFDRLEYPSQFPEKVQRRMINASKRFLEHIGFDNGCFNVEFMWDDKNDQLWVVEVNTRISQSHSRILTLVDGMSNHEVAIDIALGERPSLTNRLGQFPVAAKCYIPYQHEDGIVRRIPSQKELEELAQRFPGTEVRLDVKPGTRLGELRNQNSFSYHLGTLTLGADTHKQIEKRYNKCLEALHFEIDPVKEDEPSQPREPEVV